MSHRIDLACRVQTLACCSLVTYLCSVDEGDALIHNRLICREIVFPLVVTPIALEDEHTMTETMIADALRPHDTTSAWK